MARFDLRTLFACAAAAALFLPALTGCSYTHHAGVWANGAQNQLEFSRYESTLTTPLAVGYVLDVSVSRFSASFLTVTAPMLTLFIGYGLRRWAPRLSCDGAQTWKMEAG